MAKRFSQGMFYAGHIWEGVGAVKKGWGTVRKGVSKVLGPLGGWVKKVLLSKKKNARPRPPKYLWTVPEISIMSAIPLKFLN